MQNFIYFFPIFFISIWLLAMFFISKTGWSKLIADHKMTDTFDGTTIMFASAAVGMANYNNALIIKYNDDGLYLKPLIIFRAFHPPLFIPWKEITAVTDKKIIFTTLKILSIGDPFITTIKLKPSTFARFESSYLKSTIKITRH